MTFTVCTAFAARCLSRPWLIDAPRAVLFRRIGDGISIGGTPQRAAPVE